MHGYFSSFAAPDHLFGIGGTIINTANATYKGHRMSLVITNAGINLYDHNSGTWVWNNHWFSVSRKAGTFTPTSEFSVDAQTTVFYVGKIVWFRIMGEVRNAKGTWTDTKIGTITPAPVLNTHFPCFTNSMVLKYIHIDPQGNVFFRTLDVPTTGPLGIRGTCTYFSSWAASYRRVVIHHVVYALINSSE